MDQHRQIELKHGGFASTLNKKVMSLQKSQICRSLLVLDLSLSGAGQLGKDPGHQLLMMTTIVWDFETACDRDEATKVLVYSTWPR